MFYDKIDLETIGPPPDRDQLMNEIKSLPPDHVILRTSPYVLFICDLHDKPALRLELGREREITFRRVGESTGLPYDTDAYDDYYEQLIIWDEVAGRLVGGYRFGCGDKIFSAYGRDGFYIHSFFDIDAGFDPYLPQCLELGRSFIVKDYQRKNLPLYLLWKGILAYQQKHPQYRYLIGPVSISRFYTDFSRKVLMEFGKRYFSHPVFTKWFRPRTPFDPVLSPSGNDQGESNDTLSLENIIDQIRPEHIQYPTLMKQYIRQNARFLGFNLDPNFNDALDGLMILDMADVPANTIELLKREM